MVLEATWRCLWMMNDKAFFPPAKIELSKNLLIIFFRYHYSSITMSTYHDIFNVAAGYAKWAQTTTTSVVGPGYVFFCSSFFLLTKPFSFS